MIRNSLGTLELGSPGWEEGLAKFMDGFQKVTATVAGTMSTVTALSTGLKSIWEGKSKEEAKADATAAGKEAGAKAAAKVTTERVASGMLRQTAGRAGVSADLLEAAATYGGMRPLRTVAYVGAGVAAAGIVGTVVYLLVRR